MCPETHERATASGQQESTGISTTATSSSHRLEEAAAQVQSEVSAAIEAEERELERMRVEGE